MSTDKQTTKNKIYKMDTLEITPAREQSVLTAQSSSLAAADRSFDQVLRQISRPRQDIVTPMRGMQFKWDDSVGQTGRYLIELHNKSRFEFSFPTNKYFNEQMYSRLAKGLKPYADFMQSNGQRDLLLENVNRQLQSDDRKSLVRAQENANGLYIAKALVSDMYKPIDDDVILDAILPMIDGKDSIYKVIGGRVGMEKTHLKIVSKDPVFDIGDRPIHLGALYINSGVGASRFKYLLFICDAFCTNGIIFNQRTQFELSHTHKGARYSKEFGKLMGDTFKREELRAIQSMVKETTAAALDPARHAEFKELLEASAKRPVTGDTAEVINRLGKGIKLSALEAKLATIAIRDNEHNQYGVQAGLTRMAQELDSYDRRLEIESLAGSILTMSKERWETIAATVKSDQVELAS